MIWSAIVGSGTGPAYLPAVSEALVKLEKQIGKLTDKLRDGKRNGVKPAVVAAAAAVRPTDVASSRPRLYEAKVSKKPMNIEESVLVADRKQVNYVAFRDADSGGISVVIRRPDGDFDVVRG